MKRARMLPFAQSDAFLAGVGPGRLRTDELIVLVLRETRKISARTVINEQCLSHHRSAADAVRAICHAEDAYVGANREVLGFVIGEGHRVRLATSYGKTEPGASVVGSTEPRATIRRCRRCKHIFAKYKALPHCGDECLRADKLEGVL